MYGYGFKKFKKLSLNQDKGHFNQFKYLLDSHIEGQSPIISFDEIVNTTQSTFSAITSLIENRWVDVNND